MVARRAIRVESPDRSRSKLRVGKPSQQLKARMGFRAMSSQIDLVSPLQPEDLPHAIRCLLYDRLLSACPPNAMVRAGMSMRSSAFDSSARFMITSQPFTQRPVEFRPATSPARD